MKKIISAVLFCTIFSSPVEVSSQSTITVTDCNLNGWVKHILPNTLGTVTFSTGPLNTPLGKGSIKLASPDMSFVRLRNAAYSGTLFSSLTELSYSGYVQQRDSTVEMPFIVMLVDADGDGKSEHNLVFDPRFQTGKYISGGFPDQGTTKEQVWQTWDALHGVWFFGPFDDQDHGFPPLSLADYVRKYPNATINNDAAKGGAAIRLTSGGPVFLKNFIGYADAFKIGINGNVTTYDFEESIANAGADKTVIYGFGSNCTTLTGSGAGGVAPYTFVWSGGGVTAGNNEVQVCPTTTTTYTLKVTDANGCTGSDQVTVKVNDVRCGKNDKVFVCHKGDMLCISPSAVKAHLGHGDYLGTCSTASAIAQASQQKTGMAQAPDEITRLSNYPNPFTNTTTIYYQLPFDCNVTITVYDLHGRSTATPLSGYRKAGAYNMSFNSNALKSGTYYYKIVGTSATKSFSQARQMIVLHQ